MTFEQKVISMRSQVKTVKMGIDSLYDNVNNNDVMLSFAAIGLLLFTLGPILNALSEEYHASMPEATEILELQNSMGTLNDDAK